MKIVSTLFIKRFDYAAFSIGVLSLLLLNMNFFIRTGFSSGPLYSQIIIVFLYYFMTRGRVEQKLKSQGIEPIIALSIFAFFVGIMFMANLLIYLN